MLLSKALVVRCQRMCRIETRIQSPKLSNKASLSQQVETGEQMVDGQEVRVTDRTERGVRDGRQGRRVNTTGMLNRGKSADTR